MRKLDERGKQCPMPVIEAKQALAEAAPGEMIEVIVDNEIACLLYTSPSPRD